VLKIDDLEYDEIIYETVAEDKNIANKAYQICSLVFKKIVGEFFSCIVFKFFMYRCLEQKSMN